MRKRWWLRAIFIAVARKTLNALLILAFYVGLSFALVLAAILVMGALAVGAIYIVA